MPAFLVHIVMLHVLLIYTTRHRPSIPGNPQKIRQIIAGAKIITGGTCIHRLRLFRDIRIRKTQFMARAIPKGRFAGQSVIEQAEGR